MVCSSNYILQNGFRASRKGDWSSGGPNLILKRNSKLMVNQVGNSFIQHINVYSNRDIGYARKTYMGNLYLFRFSECLSSRFVNKTFQISSTLSNKLAFDGISFSLFSLGNTYIHTKCLSVVWIHNTSSGMALGRDEEEEVLQFALIAEYGQLEKFQMLNKIYKQNGCKLSE